MKREAITHTKLKRLCRKLDIPVWQAVGLLEMLWHITARETPRGDIGKLSDEDIALALDYRGDESAMVQTLISSGWLDEDPEHRLLVHDWPEHADDAVHMKIARARQYFADGTCPRFRRLQHAERASAEAFYATQAARRDDAVSTACAQTTDPCARNTYAVREPEPRQSPAPPEPVLKTLSAAQPAAAFELEPKTAESTDEERSEPPRGKAKPPGASKKQLNPALETELDQTARRIHGRHPAVRRSNCSIGEVKNKLRGILRRFPPADRLATLRRVDQNHEGRCGTWDWQKEGGQFAKGLDNWLAPSKDRWDATAPDPPGEKAAEPAKPEYQSAEEYLRRLESE